MAMHPAIICVTLWWFHAEALRFQDYSPRGSVQKCRKGVHTFLRFSDGGCFQHLSWRGLPRTAEDSLDYQQKGCPFAALNHENKLRRQLLVWYRAQSLGCFMLLWKNGLTSASYKQRFCPSGQLRGRRAVDVRKELLSTQVTMQGSGKEGVPPFSVSDMAQACLLELPNQFDWHRQEIFDWVRLASCGKVAGAQRDGTNCHCDVAEGVRCETSQGKTPELLMWPKRFHETYFDEKICWCEGKKSDVPGPWWLHPQQLCSTFLQLPLMWDGIGFDQNGIIWENPRVRNVRSFFGRVVYIGSFRRAFDHHCVDKVLGTKGGDLGSALHGRMVLRALLPSYYRHVYAKNMVGVLKHGVASRALEEAFRPEVMEVCGSPHSQLDHLLSYEMLRSGHLLSSTAMARDLDRCETAWPCSYQRMQVEGKLHKDMLGTPIKPDSCLLCDMENSCFSNRTRACIKPKRSVGKWKKACPSGYTRLSQSECPNWKSCQCSRAICWYLTTDFANAMRNIFLWGCGSH